MIRRARAGRSVMVCVKLWDTEAALEQLRPLVGPETTLVSFQNGVLKDSLPEGGV